MVANSLRRLMGERRMGTKELANITGIPKPTLDTAYYGHGRLNAARVRDVAKVLDVDPSELEDVCGREPGEPKPTPLRDWKMNPNPKPPEQPEPVLEVTNSDMEKMWLYLHQLARRVATLEDRVKELEKC